jgi:integrase/recombinase XerD
VRLPTRRRTTCGCAARLATSLTAKGRQLLQFVVYLEQAGASTITIEHAVAWATQPAGGECSYWADRLSVVRQFARYLQTIDPSCEVPPTRLLPCRRRRLAPHIYAPQQIEDLMVAAQDLRGELHRATMHTLIGVMAVTGMRIGEAIGLDRDDVEHAHQLLRVIDSKFGKSRELALRASTMAALDDYAQLRDRLCPRPSCEAFLISRNGTRLLSQCVHRVFARLIGAVGLEPPPGRRRPRPHDLRHSLSDARSASTYLGRPDGRTARPWRLGRAGWGVGSCDVPCCRRRCWRAVSWPRLVYAALTGCSSKTATDPTQRVPAAEAGGCACVIPAVQRPRVAFESVNVF